MTSVSVACAVVARPRPSPAHARRLRPAVTTSGDDDVAAADSRRRRPAAVDAGGASAELPDTITIGYQNVPNGDLIVKHEGWLEEAFGADVDDRVEAVRLGRRGQRGRASPAASTSASSVEPGVSRASRPASSTACRGSST